MNPTPKFEYINDEEIIFLALLFPLLLKVAYRSFDVKYPVQMITYLMVTYNNLKQ